MDRPLVSGLVVSRPERLRFLHASVACWEAQTWPERELVIVWAGSEQPEDLKRTLGLAGRADVRVVPVSPDTTLGARRNASIAHARGELVCQWDDDDLFHPERVARQVAHLRAHGKAACFVGDLVLQDVAGARAFWCDHARSPDPVGRFMHGSLLLRRSHPVRYPEEGPDALRGEDTVVARALLRSDDVCVLGGEPALFVYRFHGGNTVSALHVGRMAAYLSVTPRESARPSFHALGALGGPTYDDLGDPADAAAWYAALLAALPDDDPEALRHRAWERVRTGHTDEARAMLEESVRRGSADLTSAITLAALYRGAGDLARARPVLEPVLARYPDRAPAWGALGSLALAEGRPDEALRCFDEAVRLAPWDPVVGNDRAVVLAKLGRTRDAIAALRDVLSRDPTRAAAHDNLWALLGSARARVRAYAELAARHPDVLAVVERHARALDEAGARRAAQETRARADRLRADR